MSMDARFEEGHETPLRLMAQDDEDLAVISALLQDAVFPITEISWQPAKKRLVLLLNRFRWEDKNQAAAQSRKYERVRSLLVINDVVKISSQGIDRNDKDQIFSALALNFETTSPPSGQVTLILAGDGALAAEVECLDISLNDVTKPYGAVSEHAPYHDLS